MKHYGDITLLKGQNLPPVDIITGGSPCQDLSIAGKRAGLAGERSGLFMEQIRIVKEMRDETSRRTDELIRPRYMVWENVPGAFTSNGGEDFRAVLEETARIKDKDAVIPRPPKGKWTPSGCIMGDGWSIAWRVHDAQFWGVPQRRKRIALVADFGGATAPEILFEHKSMSRDTEESGKEGQGVATDVERGINKAIGVDSYNLTTTGTVSKTLQAERSDNEHIPCAISFQERAGKPGGGKGILIQDERTGALSTLNNQPVCYGISSYDSNAMKSSNPHSGIYKADTTRTLDNNETLSGRMGTGGGNVPMVMEQQTYQKTTGSLCASGYDKLGVQEAANDMHVVQSSWDGSQVSPTLTANNANGAQRMPDKDNFNAVITYGLDRASFNQGKNAKYDFSIEEEKIGAQVARGPGAVCSPSAIVRRLTPLECERLQGYPDYWTDIGDWIDSKGKKHKGESDAPRYKALGNSIALPFWQWMAERMCKYIDNPTMASLFDGIGGFPLVFSRSGCKPVWASEIEEFPIAVTKIRFQEDEE